MAKKYYDNQHVSKALDAYIIKYYAGRTAVMARAEGVDESYLGKMRRGKDAVHSKLLPLLGYRRESNGMHVKA